MSNNTIHELIIIGAGPGGLTAGLYASRARLDTVLVEKGVAGGQVLATDWIDNYPGFPEGISGFDLAEKMAAQAQRFGLKIANGTVTGMDLSADVKTVSFDDGQSLRGRAVIIATGARPNHLHVPGEEELTGRGVSYCATCDGPFYRDMDIAVVGGGDTALQEAVYLTKFAKTVTVIHRRKEFRAAPVIQEEAKANKQVRFLLEAEVVGIEGKKEVEALRIRYQDGKEETRSFQGVFILIGITPNSEMLPLMHLKHEQGFIVTDCLMKTNLPGVMAVGDIRHGSVRQVVTAAGDGAVAGKSVEQYLDSLHHKK
ncbi:MAG: thioredoxin-disulfide reductase [Desulfobulbaceae bacterium]|nr:thioredoxin-disulfide reductase [Desulfobulbaceae bacterium]